MKLNLTHSEVDALCLALNEAALLMQDKKNKDVAKVFEDLRKEIRSQVPHTASIDELIKKGRRK